MQGPLQTVVQFKLQYQSIGKVYNMWLFAYNLQQVLLVLSISSLAAAASWGFEDATIAIHGKKAGVGASHKEKYGAP